jgi:hypothetical protein
MRDLGDNIQTYSVSILDRLCIDDGTARIHVPATREDVLAAVRELGGRVVRFENFEGERGMWVAEATDEGKGRYLIVPLDEGDTE